MLITLKSLQRAAHPLRECERAVVRHAPPLDDGRLDRVGPCAAELEERIVRRLSRKEDIARPEPHRRAEVAAAIADIHTSARREGRQPCVEDSALAQVGGAEFAAMRRTGRLVGTDT